MLLDIETTKKLLSKYNIPFAQSALIEHKFQLEDTANKIGYPLVLKISSATIIHKTDIGGVVVNIKNQQELEDAFDQLYSQFHTESNIGFLVQKYIDGKQLIAGAKLDPTFGPIVLFGLGGIFVETLKDITFRLAPLELDSAQQMIKEIKGYQILTGIRGQKSINIKALEIILLNLSKMICNEKTKEIDFNPIVANENEALVVDAKIII